MRKLIRKIRYILVRLLLTYNEKYVIYQAVDHRIDALEKSIVNDKTIDKKYTKNDIKVLHNVRYSFYVDM